MQARQTRVAAIAHFALRLCLLVCVSFALCLQGFAQARTSGSHPIAPSRVDIFGGYSYFYPYHADINGYFSEPIKYGGVASGAYYFNRWLGAQIEGGAHPHGPNDCAFTAQAGPIVRYNMHRFVPFFHALAGGAKLGGPVFQPCTWGWGGTAGLGLDIVLPGFGDHLALRPFQADAEFNHVDYGPLVLPGGFSGGLQNMIALRGSSGLTFRLGAMDMPMGAMLSCSTQPSSILPGEPVVVTASTMGLDSHKATTYTWTTQGGQLSGRGEVVQIDTAGLTPGTYAVGGRLSQGRHADQQAGCATTFEVKSGVGVRTVPDGPPTLTCSALPSTIQPGATSNIIATGVSNRPLTYSFAASAGLIQGSGSTASLTSAGALPGPITVTCSVVDDKGRTATATTVVTVSRAPIPVQPISQQLCTITFERDRKRPARVDNEAKACLDDVALTLQRQTESRLVVIGSREAGESPDIAAERAVNTKLYLTKEKGLDGSRILVRSGRVGGRKVEHMLVPSGASFAPEDSNVVDETRVQPSRNPYGTAPVRTTTRRVVRRRAVSPRTGTSRPPDGP